jgi:nucleotide-binding universal stress UspA family protein
LKQLSEEVSWLLGVQFGVAVVPAGQDGASAVHAGRLESVTRQAIADLKQLWTFEPAEQPELVLVAVDADAEGHGWAQVARALQSARSLVARDGRIALLTQLDAPLTDGLQMVRDSRKPRDALRPLREQAPPDLQTATALAQAVEWANVYLLSRLESDLVEELFMVPLEGLDEVQRLIGGDSRCAVIGSGQHVNMVGVPAGAVGGV